MKTLSSGITGFYDSYHFVCTGARMGRPSQSSPGYTGPMRLYRLRLNRGGYDSGGAYWGVGAPLYCAESPEGELCQYFRAHSREDAKAHVLAKYPGARFYR